MSTDNNKPLVVELDGTLLQSNMLYESFWSFLGCDWRNYISIIKHMREGKASLKRFLATYSAVNIATLPYDNDVIAYIKAWRSNGGRTVLITASDDIYAQAIANHLDIFDEAYGSDGSHNLEGIKKGKFLEELFGSKGFAYMGNDHSDISVRESASEAITIHATKSLPQGKKHFLEHTENLFTSKVSTKSYLKALRPHQWLKNMLIFLPLIASHQFNFYTIFQSIFAFISFCLVASSVYVVNDLLDLSADRSHPRKKKRPLASGAIPIGMGTRIAILLVLLGFIIAAFVGFRYLLLVFAYYILTTIYSVYFKKRVIIDIFMLAGLYTFRIIAGGIATQIPLSVWLLAFSMFFFFSLAAVKRLAELVDNIERGKLKVTGRGYHVDDVPIVTMIAISSGYVSILVLAMYINSPAVTLLYRSPQVLWGVCIVCLYWITSTIMTAYRGTMYDDPLIYATKDPISRLCLFAIIILVLCSSLL